MGDFEYYFELDMMDRCILVEEQYGLNFTGLKRLIETEGAVKTATVLINQKQHYKEFYDLLKINRLDLSIEQLILEIKYIEMFDKSTVISAMNRLQKFSHKDHSPSQ